MTSIYLAIAELEKEGGSAVLCSIVRSHVSTPRRPGSKMLVYPDGSILGTIEGGEMEKRVIDEAMEALAEDRPRILDYEMADPQRGDPGICGGQLEVFVEPITPKPTIVVVGGGHVGRAVVHLAHWLDFHIVVTDDREEFCNPDAVPGGDQYLPGPLEDLSRHMKITPQTDLVLCTSNVTADVQGLPHLLDSPAAYIGVIGSRRRWETTRRQLSEAGIEAAKLDRVVSPMGLELNAETPEEIAVSILAEIIMIRRGGHGGRMGS